jgi:hypothetical protein
MGKLEQIGTAVIALSYAIDSYPKYAGEIFTVATPPSPYIW